MANPETPEYPDSTGNHHDEWLAMHVVTPDGVGTVNEDHGSSVRVNHTYETYDTINGIYEKSEVEFLEAAPTVPEFDDSTEIKHQTEPQADTLRQRNRSS